MSNYETLQIRPGLAWEQFPDEVVAIDTDRGIYFNLTGAGAEVFRCFAQPISVEAVVAHLALGFAAPPTEVGDAVGRLVRDLADNGLLVRVEREAKPLPPFDMATRTLESLALHRHDDLQNLLVIDPVHAALKHRVPRHE